MKPKLIYFWFFIVDNKVHRTFFPWRYSCTINCWIGIILKEKKNKKQQKYIMLVEYQFLGQYPSQQQFTVQTNPQPTTIILESNHSSHMIAPVAMLSTTSANSTPTLIPPSPSQSSPKEKAAAAINSKLPVPSIININNNSTNTNLAQSSSCSNVTCRLLYSTNSLFYFLFKDALNLFVSF